MSLAERLAKQDRPDRTAEVRNRVQERLVEALGPKLYDATLSDTSLAASRAATAHERAMLEQARVIERHARRPEISDGIIERISPSLPTWKNIRNSPAPSILAASIKSIGMVRMKPLIIKMVMGNDQPI